MSQDLIARLAACAMVAFLAACDAGFMPGQPAKHIPRVGFVNVGGPASENEGPFRQGLSDLGYVEGRDIVVEYRNAENVPERQQAMVQELVDLNVDVLVVAGQPLALRAKQATATIPIVFAIATDPVGSGLVASLDHPSGNVTGLENTNGALTAKRIELLKELLPNLDRVALLWRRDPDPAITIGALQLRDAEQAAPRLGLQLQSLPVSAASDLPTAFKAAADARAGAILMANVPLFADNARQLNQLAAANRLPTIYFAKTAAGDDGLIVYGASLSDMTRRSVVYMDKILKGAKPADLPVERPTKFDLVINLKTARELGLTVPQSLLAQATEIIQ